MYNEFKLERTSDSEKKEKSNLEKKDVQNLKNNVRGILLFYDKIPNKKPEVPTDILSWKVSLQLMAKKAINKLLTTSIEKGLIKTEKELTMNFLRENLWENMFGDALSFPDGYGK